MFPVIGQNKIEYLWTNSFVCNTVINLSEFVSKVFDNNSNNNNNNNDNNNNNINNNNNNNNNDDNSNENKVEETVLPSILQY